MAALKAPIEAIWARARQEPVIFNGFQLPPPTQPNRTIVHNWAFACLDFAKVINRESAIAQVFARAESVDALKLGITNARAVRIGVDDEGFDFDAVADAPRDSFYAALGSRLVLASRRAIFDTEFAPPKLGILIQISSAQDAPITGPSK